jgi:hypothetical protein
MSERDEIRKRVQAFKAHQERLNREREVRMDKLTQQIRQALSDMHARALPPLAPKD